MAAGEKWPKWNGLSTRINWLTRKDMEKVLSNTQNGKVDQKRLSKGKHHIFAKFWEYITNCSATYRKMCYSAKFQPAVLETWNYYFCTALSLTRDKSLLVTVSAKNLNSRVKILTAGAPSSSSFKCPPVPTFFPPENGYGRLERGGLRTVDWQFPQREKGLKSSQISGQWPPRWSTRFWATVSIGLLDIRTSFI